MSQFTKTSMLTHKHKEVTRSRIYTRHTRVKYTRCQGMHLQYLYCQEPTLDSTVTVVHRSTLEDECHQFEG